MSLFFHTDSPPLTFLFLRTQLAFDKIHLEIYLFGILTVWKWSYFCTVYEPFNNHFSSAFDAKFPKWLQEV